MKPRALLGLAILKLVFTAAAVWFIAARVDAAGALRTLTTLDPGLVVAAVACALLQVWFASERFVSATRMVGASLARRPALRLTAIGAFFGQAFATFVSGDLTRVWLLARRGVGYQTAGNAVLLDRVFGVAALVLLILTGLPLLLGVLPSDAMRASALLATAGIAAPIAGFLLLGRLLRRGPPRWPGLASPRLAWLVDLAGAARHVFATPGAAASAFGFGLAVQLLSVISLYLLFRGAGQPVGFSACFTFIPFVMLLTMLPLSFAGWGLREGAMVAAFDLIGVPGETTLVVSIAFGLIILASSLPGLPLWLAGDTRRPAAAPDAERSLR